MILVVGSINMDICLKVEHIPNPAETVLASDVVKNPGGKGANQAVAAAKLGADVTMLGCVGKDEHGDELLLSLKAAGVNTEYIMHCDNVRSSSAYVCISESGENTIIVDSSANMCVSPQYVKEHECLFSAADYCILQMEIPHETVKAAINLCKRYGVKTVLNPSPLTRFDSSLLEGIDYLVPNEIEASALLNKEYIYADINDWHNFMKKYSISKMIITLGSDGCELFEIGTDHIKFHSMKKKAIDTTGAGDTFLGAFVTAISEGQSAKQAAQFANAASGIEVTRFGAQQAMPTRREVENELQENFN